jgi:hypothetical protein
MTHSFPLPGTTPLSQTTHVFFSFLFFGPSDICPKKKYIYTQYQRQYDTKLRVERKKREIYYHVQSRLSDCSTTIITATTRGGYPEHKGGIASLRVELTERKVEIDRRQSRRDRRAILFEKQKQELITVKKESDFIMEMDPGEVKEQKRLSPVHVDDANKSSIAKAILAMATFVQEAGIPKKKRKKLGIMLANDVKRLLKDQNVVRLQRNQVMLINITDETPDSIALVQQLYADRIVQLQENENEKLRDHRAKMSWLKERIDLLTAIDEEVTELEAEVVVLSAELGLRREELTLATEERMQAQLELKEKKNARRVALSVFDTQLSTLEEQLCLGDVSSYVGRVEGAVSYLWNSKVHRLPILTSDSSIARMLPDLGNEFVLAHCLDGAFLLPSTEQSQEQGQAEVDHRGRYRPPMGPESFYRCIVEVILQGVLLKTSFVVPVRD